MPKPTDFDPDFDSLLIEVNKIIKKPVKHAKKTVPVITKTAPLVKKTRENGYLIQTVYNVCPHCYFGLERVAGIFKSTIILGVLETEHLEAIQNITIQEAKSAKFERLPKEHMICVGCLTC